MSGSCRAALVGSHSVRSRHHRPRYRLTLASTGARPHPLILFITARGCLALIQYVQMCFVPNRADPLLHVAHNSYARQRGLCAAVDAHADPAKISCSCSTTYVLTSSPMSAALIPCTARQCRAKSPPFRRDFVGTVRAARKVGPPAVADASQHLC